MMDTYIDGVPLIRQRNNWCGYASLAMLLQFWRQPIEAEDLVRLAYPQADLSRTDHRYEEVAYTTAAMAAAVTTLTPLRWQLWTMQRYRRDSRQPTEMLHHYLVQGRPCVVGLGLHYVVVTGYNAKHDVYNLNDPAGPASRLRPAKEFMSAWALQPTRLRPADTTYQLLTVWGP